MAGLDESILTVIIFIDVNPQYAGGPRYNAKVLAKRLKNDAQSYAANFNRFACPPLSLDTNYTWVEHAEGGLQSSPEGALRTLMTQTTIAMRTF